MTRLVIWSNRVTTASRAASRAGERILRADGAPAESQLALLARRGAQLAGAEGRLPSPRDRSRARPRRRLRRRREPLVELRPVAPRHTAVSTPLPALHGQEGALLAAARMDRALRWRVPSGSRQARPAGDRHRDRAVPRGSRRRDVPRGDTPLEGSAQAARGTVAHRGRADRARGRRAARSGRHLGNRAARPARPAAGRLRAGDRDHRPRGARRRRGGAARDRPAARGDHRARGLARGRRRRT